MRRWTWAALAVLAWACATGPEEVRGQQLPEAELRVVFLGNSLTYTHDVPALVQQMADADGRSMAHRDLVAPDFGLEDHWNGGAPRVLRALEADVVVMQQGPSTLPDNRVHLIRWSRRFAEVVREAGGVPAMYMVWPSDDRRSAFPDVRTSYRLAADSADALFIPAGQTWVEAWARDGSLRLYGDDGFHPSYLGALAAAQTIYAVLFGVPADSVPALDDGLSPETRWILRGALAESLQLAEQAER